MSPSSTFMSLLRSSPFEVMVQHIHLVTQCANQILPLTEAIIAGDGEAFESVRAQIFRLEGEADTLKEDLRANLPKSLFMPVDRNVLLQVLDYQDSIADYAQEVAGLMSQKKLTVPAEMADPLREFMVSCAEACAQSENVIRELRDLVESGFGGKTAEEAFKKIQVLSNLETQSDVKGADLAKWVFDHEAELGAVNVMCWYQIIRWAGKMADRAEAAGDRLRLMIAR